MTKKEFHETGMMVEKYLNLTNPDYYRRMDAETHRRAVYDLCMDAIRYIQHSRCKYIDSSISRKETRRTRLYFAQ